MTRCLIREMPEAERPRERLIRLGPDHLRNAELIAILLRTGMKNLSAVQLADQLLKHYRSIEALARAPLEELRRVKGIGKTKAVQLKAAFELAKRLREFQHDAPRIIREPADAADLVREEMRLLDREAFRVILLNTKNAWLKTCPVSMGSLDASIVEPREVFKEAIAASAAAVILAHNHPSGDPTPSSEDIAVTKRLAKAGELLGIPVRDHIILGQRAATRHHDFVSLRQLGFL
ncbi:MAG: DNA repair protein RadC [Verrucomicrobiae bacterium]|nr:DNA repair protein RadC [Verrucomicrobiae bacterium]